jgi:hypothetical protein
MNDELRTWLKKETAIHQFLLMSIGNRVYWSYSYLYYSFEVSGPMKQNKIAVVTRSGFKAKSGVLFEKAKNFT